nr:nucleotidyl transferase AbiEii/AbiGii toxin family protein [Cryobacterium sp. Y11]
MEAFLSRLAQTVYKDDFVLKGGVLLAAYRLRRPTSDIDMEAVNFRVDAAHLIAVVEAIAAISVDDALAVDLAWMDFTLIREGDDYSVLRVKIFAQVYTSTLSFHLDISTGDPIWPDPRSVAVPRILGGEFEMLGYPLVMVLAEKAVTMLTPGTTSTRWNGMGEVARLLGIDEQLIHEVVLPPARYFQVFRSRSIAHAAHTFEDSLGTNVEDQRLSQNPVKAQLVECQRGHCLNCVGGEATSIALSSDLIGHVARLKSSVSGPTERNPTYNLRILVENHVWQGLASAVPSERVFNFRLLTGHRELGVRADRVPRSEEGTAGQLQVGKAPPHR